MLRQVFPFRFVHGRFTQFVAISLRRSQGERQRPLGPMVILVGVNLCREVRIELPQAFWRDFGDLPKISTVAAWNEDSG